MLKLNQPHISDEDLKKAVELFSSECYGAMQMMNSLGGAQTVEWQLLHNNSWKDLVAEVKSRNLPVETWKCAITETPVTQSGHYQFAAGLIDEARKKKMFQTVKQTNRWPNLPTTIRGTIGYYRDGGTVSFNTDAGLFYINFAIASQNLGRVFHGDPNGDGPMAEPELEKAVLELAKKANLPTQATKEQVELSLNILASRKIVVDVKLKFVPIEDALKNES